MEQLSDIRKLYKCLLLCILLGLIFSGNVFAGPGQKNKREIKQNHILVPSIVVDKDKRNKESNKKKKRKGKVKVFKPEQVQKDWERARFANIKADKKRKHKKKTERKKEERKFRKQRHPKVPPPPSHISSITSQFKSLLRLAGDFLSPASAYAASPPNQYGDIVVDGSLSDWTIDDRINLPLDLPPYLASGNALYGKYIDQSNSVYVIALKSTAATIGPNTTFWLNTDQDDNTGYKIWGLYGGAEYFINIYSDSSAHLYNSSFEWVAGPLDHAYSADNSILEIAIPTNLIPPTAEQQSINILGDINDSILLFPQDYADGGQYSIPGLPEVLPPRTDFSKRVGIVFSETSKSHFFQEKAYSQLFMSLQHQAMMAGISFDLLNENDLTDIGNIVNYDALIFPYFANVPNSIRDQVVDTLYKGIYKYGIGIITADNWITNDETGASFSGDAYRVMKRLLGIGRVDGQGPVDIKLTASDVSTPAMKGYAVDELLLSYIGSWYSYFEPVPGQLTNTLAEQEITVSGVLQGKHPAVIASTTGGRHVHFANLGLMGDGAIAWQALQWIVYGNDVPVGLNLTRNNSLFVSRNDMDQAQEHDELPVTEIPLYDLIQNWKQQYNFVGSYYIDIGNNPGLGQWTDWNISGPLYRNYIALGNEIGTHSWTHPHFTDLLTPAEIEFEFNQSMNEISANVGFTWQGKNIRGGAVPGAPESFTTAAEIMQYLTYLSGGWASVGAGYPSAFGYLSPEINTVYFSPNMSFDFTMIEFGVPVGNPPVPMPLTAEEAEQYWKNEYDTLMNHASSPIIHWPWHDYGPTTGADPATSAGYTVAMFENTIAYAYNDWTEFATAADVADRIATFTGAKMTVDPISDELLVTVDSTNAGRFSLNLNLPSGQVIHSVDNWYAYNDDKVFTDDNGGMFLIRLGAAADAVSRVTALPMRSRLIDVSGNGTNLDFTIEGEGTAVVTLSGQPVTFTITGADSFVELADNQVALNFTSFGVHTVNITRN